ncbi:MAG: MATE family efflux transporter [Candidatus Aminicenantes bacterium]|nr:MATE family efflux transporter [Candidatus Aminicenantes bacterium]
MRGKRLYTNSLRDLFYLSLPTFLSFFLQNLYSLVDIFWISKLGTDAIAAISLASIATFIVFTLSQTIAVGTTAYVSQFKGKKDWDNIREFSTQSLSLAVYGGILLAIPIIVYPKIIMVIMGAKAQVINIGSSYLVPLAFFIPMFMISFAINAVFRATGDTYTPMVILTTSNLLNIILDPIFIFTFKMGVKGAAIATGISYSIAFLYGLYKLIKFLEINPFKPHRPDFSLGWKILKVGIPSGIQFTIMSLTMFVLLRIVASYGSEVVAAVGIVGRLLNFLRIPTMGFAISASIVCGQYLGMENFKEAEKTIIKTIILNEIVIITLLALIFPYGEQILLLFSKDPAVLKPGIEVFRFFMLTQLFVAINITISSSFRAAGDTLPPLYISIVRLILLSIIAPVLGKLFSLRGIWEALVISAFLSSILSLIFFIKRDWKKRAVTIGFKMRMEAQKEV